MRVVVTGGSGKIGQFVVRALVGDADGRTPHEVTVFDRIAGPAVEGVRYLIGDVRDLGQVVGALANAQAVIHLAISGPPPSPTHATSEVTFGTNVMGTYNVHEAAALLGIRRVTSTSSGAILGWTYCEREFPPHYLPIDEEHPVQPQDPYGLSKEVGEAIARSYTAKCGMETVVIRPTTVLSPGQLEEVRKNGGRQARRFDHYSYVDVRDLADAYRLAVERPLPGHTVLWAVADDSIVAEPLNQLLPRLMPSIGDMARDLSGSRPALLNSRAKELLGWQPRWSWRQ
ncbi:MAG TPA: NAD(P)-dependent oxidoreductase [Chloroflexota bacterium]|nr:NAD(P)-dependent oxidoreductase [Chloroflexota bacterium]